MPKFKSNSRDVPADENAPDKESEDGDKKSMGSKISSFGQKMLQKGKKEVHQTRLGLSHSVGLGHKPNVVPKDTADISGELRTVELGWHPVAGSAGKWFASSLVGKQITDRVGQYPDPTQHWAVIVGDYVHQLWMDVNLDVIYINEELKRDDWKTFQVGRTRFNDQALRQAAKMTIHNMQEKNAAYNLISNNCQNFAVNLLDAVQIGAHKDFATSFAIYQRATGEGEIKELFVDKHPEDQALKADEESMPHPERKNTVQMAQQVMDDNTTKLEGSD